MPKPSDYLQGYEWVASAHNYRRPNGTFVKRDRILELLEQSIAQREGRMVKGTQAFLDGKISARAWVSRESIMLKREYLQNAALGAGGWDRLTPEQLRLISQRLNAEYARLGNLADQIAAGQVTEAQALSRLHMYQGNARQMYFIAEQSTLPKAPQGTMYITRRLLGAAEHCKDCLDFAGQGWQPEGVLPVPSEGSVCDGNCRCTLERRLIPVDEQSKWIGTKG